MKRLTTFARNSILFATLFGLQFYPSRAGPSVQAAYVVPEAFPQIGPEPSPKLEEHSNNKLSAAHPLQTVSPIAVLPSEPGTRAAIIPDSGVQAMIEQIYPSTVSAYDGGLSGEWPVMISGEFYTMTTRHTEYDIPAQKSTQFVYDHLQTLGIAVQYHTYTHPWYGERRNVIAEQAGTTHPERIFMITAHLDSTSYTPEISAPGADDNASGSTAVLIAADILSQYECDSTLRFALFTGEEQGLRGSLAYAEEAALRGDNILGVLNLDMIGYNGDNKPVIELHTRSPLSEDQAIASLFASVLRSYQINLVPEIIPSGIQGSDHAAFWKYDFPAILAIEDFEDFTPFYHTANDGLDSLDLNYFTNFVKAAVATFAHMGCIPPNYYDTVIHMPSIIQGIP